MAQPVLVAKGGVHVNISGGFHDVSSPAYGVSRKAGKPPRKRPASPSPLPPRPGEPEMPSIELTDMLLSLEEGPMAIDFPFSASDAAFQS